MGDTLNTVTAGIASGGIGAIPSLAGGGGKPATPAYVTPAIQSNAGDNIFQAYNKVMPQGFNTSAPQNNPSAVLNAYMNNMPQLMEAARNTKDTTVGVPELTNQNGMWTFKQWLANNQDNPGAVIKNAPMIKYN